MQELPFLRSARRLMLIDICIKFHEDSFRGFQVTERTRFVTDRWTDGRKDGRKDGRTDTRGKTICLPTLRGGDINNLNRKVENLNIMSGNEQILHREVKDQTKSF